VIVIEGTDMMGKTTLAQQLWTHPALQERGYEIQHLSRLPHGHDRCWHYVQRMNQNAIFDRFYLSEIAYAEAREDTFKPFSSEHLRWVHANAQIHGVYTILLLAEPAREVLEPRYRDGEMYNLDVILKANIAFSQLRSYADAVCVQHTPDDFLNVEEIEGIIDDYLTRKRFIESL
jgi:thymidylate kinase